MAFTISDALKSVDKLFFIEESVKNVTSHVFSRGSGVNGVRNIRAHVTSANVIVHIKFGGIVVASQKSSMPNQTLVFQTWQNYEIIPLELSPFSEVRVESSEPIDVTFENVIIKDLAHYILLDNNFGLVFYQPCRDIGDDGSGHKVIVFGEGSSKVIDESDLPLFVQDMLRAKPLTYPTPATTKHVIDNSLRKICVTSHHLKDIKTAMKTVVPTIADVASYEIDTYPRCNDFLVKADRVEEFIKLAQNVDPELRLSNSEVFHQVSLTEEELRVAKQENDKTCLDMTKKLMHFYNHRYDSPPCAKIFSFVEIFNK